MTPQELDTIFRKISTFDKTLGLEYTMTGPAEVTYTLTVDERHLSSPQTCHGAVIAGMMDSVLGLTVLSYSVTLDKLCSTVEFKTNFIAPALIGDKLIGTAKLDYVGNSLVVCNGEIIAENDKRVIAKAMGTFNLYPLSKKDLHKWS
ncbi:PaaI family thioesterase [Halobacteriovorax sp. HLS]|uniref:PaaI family thioesterase n=1 Tax=Halobacteriovorax sp. HLS TaxID=2234000 RepID=UPI000FDCB0C8|nr:PaaI family thioesterase [Halobacteriovorax sp. HLS]